MVYMNSRLFKIIERKYSTNCFDGIKIIEDYGILRENEWKLSKKKKKKETNKNEYYIGISYDFKWSTSNHCW